MPNLQQPVSILIKDAAFPLLHIPGESGSATQLYYYLTSLKDSIYWPLLKMWTSYTFPVLLAEAPPPRSLSSGTLQVSSSLWHVEPQYSSRTSHVLGKARLHFHKCASLPILQFQSCSTSLEEHLTLKRIKGTGRCKALNQQDLARRGSRPFSPFSFVSSFTVCQICLSVHSFLNFCSDNCAFIKSHLMCTQQMCKLFHN